MNSQTAKGPQPCESALLLQVAGQLVLRHSLVGCYDLLLFILLCRQAVREYGFLEAILLLKEEVGIILVLGVVLEVGQVELPFLDRMVLLVV